MPSTTVCSVKRWEAVSLDSVLDLLSVTSVRDENGVWRETETPRRVFCRVDSVTRSEFFGAGRNGLNPAYKFTVFAGDYQSEPTVVYDGSSYSVYRTYHIPGTDYLELYVERKGGSNGKNVPQE